jgi:hypothetical protein
MIRLAQGPMGAQQVQRRQIVSTIADLSRELPVRV